jgi:hypothetical protein
MSDCIRRSSYTGVRCIESHCRFFTNVTGPPQFPKTALITSYITLIIITYCSLPGQYLAGYITVKSNYITYCLTLKAVSKEVDSWLGCGYEGVMAAKDPDPRVNRVYKESLTTPEIMMRSRTNPLVTYCDLSLPSQTAWLFSVTMRNCRNVIFTALCKLRPTEVHSLQTGIHQYNP